jgi:hypothetical protein
LRRLWGTCDAPAAIKMHTISFAVLAALVACAPDVVPPPEPPKPVVPLRGASGDSDLRVMLSELASSQACAKIRGGFHGLRAVEHPEVVTGVLWIRECKITNVGARVKFHIAGNGWTWIDETKSKAGGTFAVHQYVRFSIAATLRGEIDIAYDRAAHVATLWFTPDKKPEVVFETIGDIEVDSRGVWSSVVGTLGTVFATSPEAAALEVAKLQGTHDLDARLANGFAVTVNLCTGLRRTHLGRPARGEMGPASVGETRRVFVDVEPDGVILSGPELATEGMSLRATASRGPVRLSVMCAKHAATVASAFLEGRTDVEVPMLGSIETRTQARLEIEPTACPVVVVVTPLAKTRARVAWERPTAESAASTGGPMIDCRSDPR